MGCWMLTIVDGIGDALEGVTVVLDDEYNHGKREVRRRGMEGDRGGLGARWVSLNTDARAYRTGASKQAKR